MILQANWTCGSCGRRLGKPYPPADAIECGIEIACPYCDPDNLASYGVKLVCPVCGRGPEHMIGCPRMLDGAP